MVIHLEAGRPLVARCGLGKGTRKRVRATSPREELVTCRRCLAVLYGRPGRRPLPERWR